MRSVVAIAALLGCGHGTSNSIPAPPSNAAVVDDASELAHHADEVFAAERRLDYRRPFEQHAAVAQSPAMYLRACRAGDRRSCSFALELGASEALKIIEDRCLHGDLLSCRGLPHDQDSTRPVAAPGAAGRSRSCQTAAEHSTTCKHDELDRECAQGFAVSCEHLVEAIPEAALARSRRARAVELAREGCRLGLLDECEALIVDGAAEDRLLGREQGCKLSLLDCGGLAETYLAQKAPLRARDAMEYACQFGRQEAEDNCIRLARAYRSGTFPEPVAGRGRALLEWSCQRLATSLDEKEMAELYPECPKNAGPAAPRATTDKLDI